MTSTLRQNLCHQAWANQGIQNQKKKKKNGALKN